MSVLTFLPNTCEGLSEEGTEESPRALSSPCSVSPLPPTLLFAAAKLKVLKTSHFYCAVLICLPGSFMLWAEWHVTLFWGKKGDFSVMHIHEAALWLLWQLHQWQSRSVCLTCLQSPYWTTEYVTQLSTFFFLPSSSQSVDNLNWVDA